MAVFLLDQAIELLYHRKVLQFFHHILFILLFLLRLQAVEILEADPVLSGRLAWIQQVDTAFGKDFSGADFRPNDYLLGTIYAKSTHEVAPIFAFRVNQHFIDELNDKGNAQFMFTIPSLHEGDARRVLPVKVFLLKGNSSSAANAAGSAPVKQLGEISDDELAIGRLYRFPLNGLGSLNVGDIIWIGLDGNHPKDETNHNLLVGGDMVSLPGSVPPMIVAGSAKALSETVMGMSSLTLLHRRLNAPKQPGMEWKVPVKETQWVNPFTSHRQIDQLEAIQNILHRELDKLPNAKRNFRGHSLGFHSSTKPMDQSWTLNLPVNGVATALWLVPAIAAQGDTISPFAFPKRFSIVAHLAKGAGSLVVADWTQQDFPLLNSSPVMFSFPWQLYDSIDFTIHTGEPSSKGHMFALEELFLYRPTYEIQSPTVVKIAESDGVVAEPYWNPAYLTDGITSLGPAYMEKVPGSQESIISFPPHSQEEPAITLKLPLSQQIWSIDLYPIIDPENSSLPSVCMPKKMTIEFAKDPEFKKIISSFDATPSLLQIPEGGNPINIRFNPINATYIRLRFMELPILDGMKQLGIAEIRANEMHRLTGSEIFMSGCPNSFDPKSLIDNHANGYLLGDPLPWIIRLIRRDVVNAELKEVDAGMTALLNARQRTFRLLFLGIGITIVAGLGAILFWQKRKSIAENLRVRRRIQQDLHDEIGSNLGTVSLVTSHLMRADLPEEYLEEISDVNRSAREATSSLREVIWLTDKSILTLDKAFIYMEMRAEQMVRDCKLIVELPKSVPALRISSSFKRNLFLLFTEAIHNSQKHSGATQLKVVLGITGSDLSIKIIDNGCGFDPDTVRQGIGMQSMRDRATQMGGIIKMNSTPSAGATVEFTAKLPTNKKPHAR